MNRWKIEQVLNTISWTPTLGEKHVDDLEMAGYGCADVVVYGVNAEGRLLLRHHPVFPSLRKSPNDTHASFQLDMKAPVITADGEPLCEMLDRVEISLGELRIFSHSRTLRLTRFCFPAATARASYEEILVENCGDRPILLRTDAPACEKIVEIMGPMGICIAECSHDLIEQELGAGETLMIRVAFTGRYAHQPIPENTADADRIARRARAEELTHVLRMETGNEVLDTLFAFSKLRAGESVFDTRYGKIHSPGGYSYYAATWCNDQVEYAGPYFACTGDENLIEASLNAYRMYMPFMSDSYEPIPSSVIAEGVDYWNGAGDRGDAAMYLYGASRFALSCGSERIAKELLPAIRWCAEYCMRKKNEEGVIASDSDELEGRFSSGSRNLNTSCLCLAGLRYASILCDECGEKVLAAKYRAEQDALATAIERAFGANLHGFDTYAYHDGCSVLRSWICMPLCVGLFDRADGTASALTSSYLLRPDGFLTSEDDKTIWDRSTLYALRGLFAAGQTEKALTCLQAYSAIRLLGDRVPYPVEAYPEGGRRHLSGESALYCKVFIEGLLGLEPIGMRAFTVCPRLPQGLERLYLSEIHAHGTVFGVFADQNGTVVRTQDGKILASGKVGETLTVRL